MLAFFPRIPPPSERKAVNSIQRALREQEILLMDFRNNMTQLQIGRQLGISQMHVSRLRTRALGHLRSRLLDLGERAS